MSVQPCYLLADIAVAQCSFQNPLCTLRAQTLLQGEFCGMFAYRNEKRSGSLWKHVQTPKRINFLLGHPEKWGGSYAIKAVATLEAHCSVETENGYEGNRYVAPDTELSPTSNEDSIEMDFRENLRRKSPTSSEESIAKDIREKLRRKRISKANKGNTPWNKGRKHSAETLQRIRERTKLAMQDPKVKLKLLNLGHGQTKETRIKIGIGVRMGWQKRREHLMLQEMCYCEWRNLVAEASRKGCVDEEELQWDSYKTLDQQLEHEWLESVEQRKAITKTKGNKRAPKPLEQRRKISQAIYAKWAEPEYRERVCSALAKYHGMPDGAQRTPRKRRGSTKSSNWSPANRKAIDDVSKERSQNLKPKLKTSDSPVYKDPLVTSKLKMIKNIRTQRAAAEEARKNDAVERAMLLIAEADKAAKALEVAAMRNPLARSSLSEARRLIHEAVQSVESIEMVKGQIKFSSQAPPSLANYLEGKTGDPVLNGAHGIDVNGVQAIDLRGSDETEISGSFLDISNGKPESNGNINGEKALRLNGRRYEPINKRRTTVKKWVRGRLVEVPEDSQ